MMGIYQRKNFKTDLYLFKSLSLRALPLYPKNVNIIQNINPNFYILTFMIFKNYIFISDVIPLVFFLNKTHF
jgi:hypothetical protein